MKKNTRDSQAVAWLLKPLRLELRQGCQNTAVAGGLEKWLPRLKEKLVSQAGAEAGWAGELVAPLAGYAQHSQTDRKNRVEEVLRNAELFSADVPPPASPPHLPPDLSIPPKAVAPRVGSSHSLLLSDPIQYFKGVGPQRARLLKKIGIETLDDLLRNYPREWQDRKNLTPIHRLKTGETAVACGVVRMRTTFRIRRGLTLTKIVLDDGTGRLEATWFNQPYMRDRFEDGQKILVFGKVEFYRSWKIANPEYEILGDEAEDSIHTGRIVPIYTLTEGISQRVLRSLLYSAVQNLPSELPESLPPQVMRERQFPSRAAALRQIHFPETPATLQGVRQRLIFEELFFQQLAVGRLRRTYQAEVSTALLGDGPLARRFLAELPFKLTGAQTRSWEQLRRDVGQSRPMHRLLQGDVGSGKTVLAVLALLAAVDSRAQGALMAPTEILAGQHFLNVRQWLEPLGVRIELISSALKAAERREVQERLASGDIQIAVGTHALTHEKVVFQNLAIAVIDEQHRFGVEQRALLRAKGVHPHVLVMTATPIPRTLALTVYGDLDVSVIDELPPGRVPIQTQWLQPSAARTAFEKVHQELAAGRQAYIVFPLIEESEKVDLKALTTEYERLSRQLFPQFRVGLLHGRQPAAEREAVMAEFKAGAIQILASTTVIEVGVDVPNASVMIVENADRFGLAQLHQLRGRVGRGKHAAFCYLISHPTTEEGKARMEIMTRVKDGFHLAEEDLSLRGPGEFLGVRQHGLPDLKIANLVRDAAEIENARKAVESLLKTDPELSAPGHQNVKATYQTLYGEREKNLSAG